MAALKTAEWKKLIRPVHDRLYDDLVSSTGCGTFDGGCLILAQALRTVIGGEIVVLTRSCDMADHAVIERDGRLWDYDGPLRPAAFIKRFNRSERACCMTFRSMREGDLPDAVRDETIVSRIAILLAEALSTAIPLKQNGARAA